MGERSNGKTRRCPPRTARHLPSSALLSLLSRFPGMVYRQSVDRDQTVGFVGEQCVDLTGHSVEDLVRLGPKGWRTFIHSEDRARVDRKIREAVLAKRAFHVFYRTEYPSDHPRWISEQGYGVFNLHGRLITIEGFVGVVPEDEPAELLAAEPAIRDALTRLYNRRFFDKRINVELARARRGRQSMSILLCDLDQFRAVNEARGLQAGDELLDAVAKAFQSLTRGTDLIVRWGGDEFVVVLSDTDGAGGLIVAEHLRRAVRQLSETRAINLDLSVGIAVYPDHGQSADQLMRLADRALFIAKQSGEKVHLGEEHYQLNENTIKIVFQPIVDVWNNNVLAYEALSRDSEGELTVEALFKKYQSVGRLNELKAICFKKQLLAADELGLQRVFINVDLTLLERLDPALAPRRTEVILEISERETLHDIEKALATAMKWRAHGFKFAIDDFGAGFVSLPFVARLMPEYIKIDRSLVLQAVNSDTFKGFSKHLLLALRMYATEGVIVEGIETERELATMKTIGIFLFQGFLFGQPEEFPGTQHAEAA